MKSFFLKFTFSKFLALVLVHLFLFNLAEAKEKLSLETLYQRYKRNFDSNPYFQWKNINLARNSIPSTYLKRIEKTGQIQTGINNATPYTHEQIKALEPARFMTYEVFKSAFTGYRRIVKDLKPKNQKVLTIIDFDQPTTARRLYVLDLKSQKVIMNSVTSHGVNSAIEGTLVPKKFSNRDGSLQSSLGFYLTDLKSEAAGRFFYRLKVHGIDGELNSNAHSRAILFHNYHPMDVETLTQASWSDPTSWGCFGLPIIESGRFYGLEDRPLSELVMDKIAGGSVFFVYSSEVNLWKTSKYLNIK